MCGLQEQTRISGTLTACDCGRQPKAWHARGKGLFFLECSPCGERTAKYPTLNQAIDAWEVRTERLAIRHETDT